MAGEGDNLPSRPTEFVKLGWHGTINELCQSGKMGL